MSTAPVTAAVPSKSAPPPAAPPKSTAPSAPPKFIASQLLDISLIEPDPHNPRKDFPKEQMNTLISSVMLLGVRQPIEVRPIAGGKFRIVAGERRFRASKAAGLKEVPAVVRNLTDLEAAEMQLAENLERADLSPLEIAGGYQRQLDLGRTIDQVCERAGKKRSAVYAMLQLLQLGDAGRKALGEEHISTSVAQLVARVPKAQQDAALSMVLGTSWQGPLTFKQAEAQLARVFLVDLNKAPWKLKDEGIPCVATSCSVCPKRTGNAPDLYPDVKNKDACTDQPSYRQKLFNFAKAGVEKAGLKLLKPDDAPAEKLFYNGGRGQLQQDSGYVDPAERCHDDTQSRSYKDLLTPEQRKKLTVVALDADGKQRQLYERAGLTREVKKGGLFKPRKVGKPVSGSPSRSSSSSSPAHYRPPPPDIGEIIEKAGAEQLVALLAKKGLTPALLKQIVVQTIGRAECFELPNGAKRWNFDEKTFEKVYPKPSLDLLIGLLIHTTIIDEAMCMGHGLDELLKENGVDKKKLEAEVKKANPVLWSEDKKGATGRGTKDGAEYVIAKKGKAFVFTKPKAADELKFDSLDKAKATAAKVELGQAVWKPEEPAKKGGGK